MIQPLYRTLFTLTTAVALTAAMPAYSLSDDTQAAKDEGMRLYGISQSDSAIPLLEQAAEAGDVEAMYYLGEANRRLVMGNMNRAALDWYYQAAQHGEPYAMLRLHSGGACKLGDVCPDEGDDWREAALDETLPEAEDGDAEAMMALYYIYAELENMDAANHWLLEAAEADNVHALDWLGRKTRSDDESYPNDTERWSTAAEWFNRAAEQGYGPSMNNLSVALMNLERFEDSYEWLVEASDAGVIDARQHLAWCYIEPDHSGRCLNEPRELEGLAIFAAIEEKTGSETGQFVRDKVEGPLTDEMKNTVEDFKMEWLNHASPLSYFSDKYGY